MKKLYLAKASRGSYDDYYQYVVFASEDKQKIENWVNKFNNILNKWSDYYNQFEDEGDWIDDKHVQQYFERWYQLKEQNPAFIGEIELR